MLKKEGKKKILLRLISKTLKLAILAEIKYVQDAHPDSPSEKVAKELVIEDIKQYLAEEISDKKLRPIDRVQWVNIEDVVANDYNPNAVAKKEMKLLLKSIEEDGYTQPLVVVRDEEKGKFVIVNGFHRTTIMKSYPHIRETTNGKLPVVVMEKDISARRDATVRHNRARGTHSVVSISEMVFELLDKGWTDEQVANELGMEAEEVVRLKHITGFSALFKDREYNKSWETKKQLLIRKAEKEKNREAFDS